MSIKSIRDISLSFRYVFIYIFILNVYSQVNNSVYAFGKSDTSGYISNSIDYSIDSIVIEPFTQVNSNANDYGICIIEGVAFFTSDRHPGWTSKNPETKLRHENIFFSIKENNTWLQPAVKELLTRKTDYAIGGCADISNTILVYDGQYGEGEIFYFETLDSVHLWGPQNVLFDTSLWDVRKTSAFLSTKTNELFFTANIQNMGYGGTDIYIARKLPNGRWGDIHNIGQDINTSSDEEGVFFINDTLYFSSNGISDNNKYNIYYSIRKESNRWTEPQKLPYPISSSSNDLYYIRYNRLFFLSSDRSNETLGYNIFKGTIYDKQTDALTTEKIVDLDPNDSKDDKDNLSDQSLYNTDLYNNFLNIRMQLPDDIAFYKVQVGAYKKVRNIGAFMNLFPLIEDDVIIQQHHDTDTLRFLVNEKFFDDDPEVHIKVSELLEKAVSQYHIYDSFIAAYNEQGVRVAIIWSIEEQIFLLL